MGYGNDLYVPSCGATCSATTLASVGDTDCGNETNIEIAEINELYIDEVSATAGVPKNPITGWTNGDVDKNATELTTWKGTHHQSTSGKVRTFYGVGEKPEPQITEISLHKGKKWAASNRHMVNFTINIIDDTTYLALRTLQACGGTYHIWYATDTYLYGGLNGIEADIEKVVFTKSGGRGDNSKAVITLGFNARSEPVRDPKTW